MPFPVVRPQVMRVRIARTLELEGYRQQAEQKAKRFESIASTDSLTGLWNRAYLSEQLPQLLQEGHRVAFLMIDVDHFKSVNDKLGHIMGDTVLKRLAGVLRGVGVDAANDAGNHPDLLKKAYDMGAGIR